MTRRATLVLALGLLAGCFDSLVGSPCAAGYRLSAGACLAADAGPGDGGADGGGPEVVCAAPLAACDGACRELSSDADHCGVCGRACPSGLCTAGHCEGGVSGHIVAIGHDYRRHHGAMARVLGNAVALAPSTDVALGRLRGSAAAASSTGVTLALTSSMTAIGRPWHEVALPAPSAQALIGVDVLLIEAQTGDGSAAAALGAAWASAIDGMLASGGVVVVLHGGSGVSHRLAQAAALYTVAAPASVTNQQALVANSSDALAQAVVSPYLAEDSSVSFADVSAPVIVTGGGVALVFHLTRY